MKSKFRKILQLVLTLVMVLSFSLCFVACGDDEDETITNTHEYTLHVGETKYLDFFAESKGVQFSLEVSDASIISVEKSTGKIDALAVGSSEIIQTFSNKKTKWAFTVVESNFVPEDNSGDESALGNKELDIGIHSLTTTVGGITKVSSVLKNISANDVSWKIADGGSTIIKITPTKDTCVVEGLSEGSTKLMLSDGIITDVIDVVVKKALDTHEHDSYKDTVVKLNYTSIKSKVGAYATVELVTDLDASSAVWTNSAPSIVSINVETGNKIVYLQSLAIGSSIVKVQIGDYYAECAVIVESDTLTQLATVSLSITDNVLSWNAIPNASGYEYSTDGGYRWDDVEPNGTNACSHVIDPNFPAGKYDFMVRAKGDGITYKSGDSDFKTYITDLYTTFANATNKLSWYVQDGETSYTINVSGTQPFVVNSGDYALNGRIATYTLSELVRNEDIYVSSVQKDGNVVNYIGEDLGLVVIYSGVGNSNPNATFKMDDKVVSVKVNGVEKPFVQEDGKVTLTDYLDIAYGEKIPFVVELADETIESNVVMVPRVLYAGDTNYVSPEATFVNNLNTNYYAKYKDINKVDNKQYELILNDATEFTVTVGDVTITRKADDMLAKPKNIETVYVRIDENTVEKVRLGVATAFIEDGDQLANLTYIAARSGKWSNRTCHVCGHTWRSADDVVVDGVVVCPKEGCATPWDGSKDGRFGRIFSYGSNEVFALNSDIDYFGQKAIYEAEHFGNLSLSSYSSWGFQGVIDGNGYTVYNASDRLFTILSETSTIKNLGVSANVSSSNVLAKFTSNGTIDNCYFDIYVTNQAGSEVNAVADVYVTHTGDKTPKLINSFINVTIDSKCNQHVYAISKNATGADFSQTIIATPLYANDNAMYNPTVGEPLVAPTLVGAVPSQNAIKAFLAQPGINQGAFINDNGVLKFAFTRPEEVSVDLIFAKYNFNEDYDGRVVNTSDLVVAGYENIPASTFDGVTPGTVVPVLLEKSADKIVTANVKVVTGAISTAKELSRMIYLSADTKPGNAAWDGYYVLTSNIDMYGYSMVKNNKPGTLFNSGSWGFRGTLDGAGYTVFNLNDKMFYQLGDWNGTIKNLSLINMTKPLATCLGGVTIDNCYFQFVYDSIYATGNPLQEYNHVIGHCVGDGYPRDVVVRNSVIEVINNTSNKVDIIGKVNPVNAAGYEGRVSTLKYDNVIVVGDSNLVGLGDDTISKTGITQIAPGATYTGNTDGFSDVMWYKGGKFPTFQSFVDMGVVEQTYYYGRYILDRDNQNATKINDQDFVATLPDGATVTISKDVFNIGENGMLASPNSSKWTLKQKASNGRYYTLNVVFVNFAVNDATDLANLALGLNMANWGTGVGAGTLIGINNDIDMAGVTMVQPTGGVGGGSYAGSWGYKGTLLGGGRTISNLNTTIFPYINSAATVKDLTIKITGANGALAYRSSGVQLINVNFEVNAIGLDKVCLVNKTYLSRTVTTLTDCSVVIKNASDSFVCCVDYGPNADYDKGAIILNNVSVKMANGSFRLSSQETTEYDLSGNVNTTIASASLDKRDNLT